MTRPNFIIIGAMKCATSTLHSQLAALPGIFMSEPKEPNFFSDDEYYEKGIEWYKSLFSSAKTSDICGESSTHYTKFPDYPFCVERMSDYLPKPKLIYIMRHPVDRLISHYIHQWSQNIITCNINQAIDNYPELSNYSCYAMQLKPYIAVFGKENILPIFFEAVESKPQLLLEQVARFIGYNEPVVWREDIGSQNVSQERIRPFPGYDWLIESHLMSILRRALIPKAFRNIVKKQLTMKKRPLIDAIHEQKLITIFDADLKQLGNWLGIDLNCSNFKKSVEIDSLVWRKD